MVILKRLPELVVEAILLVSEMGFILVVGILEMVCYVAIKLMRVYAVRGV